ncbi:hypothetical protein NL676_034946 [Syzygium grande]|nr:hypothetical protein NL676_034946 [Syzygium grande]
MELWTCAKPDWKFGTRGLYSQGRNHSDPRVNVLLVRRLCIHERCWSVCSISNRGSSLESVWGLIARMWLTGSMDEMSRIFAATSNKLMECNKEEAVRAKEIAEARMRSNHFAEALRLARKAQRLFPELENLSQMLAVCEIHCSAQTRVSGSEHDWYAILQVEESADDTTIRKQYRKFALLLHPDKNKFTGAEAAFKLIAEANRVLTNQMQRKLDDRMFRNSARPQKPPDPPPTRHSGGRRKKRNRNKSESPPNSQFPSSNADQQEQQRTFWTRQSILLILISIFLFKKVVF